MPNLKPALAQSPRARIEAELAQLRAANEGQPHWRQPPATPADHVEVLHGRSEGGGVEIAQPGGQGWGGRLVPLEDLGRYVARVDRDLDTYLSQGRFFGPRRRILWLASIGSLFVDFDFYRTQGFGAETPESMAWHVCHRCDEAHLPLPSYIIATGRGLCAVWLHEDLPRTALPRWNAAERALIRAFAGMGADAAAGDATRVFRLLGTANTRADSAQVRAVYPVPGGPVERYAFDELAESLLPYTRDQVAAFRQRARAAQDRDPRFALAVDTTAGLLWVRRFEDMQRLRCVRWWSGDLPPGQRDLWLFVTSCALAWMVPAGAIRREVLELAREAMGCAWSERQIIGQMGAVVRRAEAAARGETILWEGRRIDPRYRFRNETIREWLAITPEEECAADLQCLVSPQRLSTLQAHRARIKAAKCRSNTAERDAEIVAAVLSGEGQRAVARRCQLAVSTVQHIVRRAAEGVTDLPV